MASFNNDKKQKAKTGDHKALSREKLTARFNRTVKKAQAAIFYERLAPKLMGPGLASGIFLSASWAGLWQPLPPAARMAGVLIFGAAALASPFLTKSGSLRVTKEEALKRLDDNIGDPSRPARTLRDKIAETRPPVEKEIWDIHLAGLWEKWGDQFKAGKPRSTVAKRDPFGIRFALILSLAVTGYMAGDQKLDNIYKAFEWDDITEQTQGPLQIKAWVTPPEKIDRAPLYLSKNTTDQAEGGKDLVAHKNSTMTILAFGKTKIYVNGKEIPVEKQITSKNARKDRQPAISYQYKIKLTGEETDIVIKNGPTWHFKVLPDEAPKAHIKSTKTDKEKPNSVVITYSTDDDHGVEKGTLTIKPKNRDPEAKPLPSGKVPPLPLP